MLYRGNRPPIGYGPPPRFSECVVCRRRFEAPRQLLCSEECRNIVAEHLQIDQVPPGLSRNEQIRKLAARGGRLPWIAAWYGLTYGRIKSIAQGTERPGPGEHISRRTTSWLNRKP